MESYMPVPWDFREMVEEAIKQEASGTINYFGENDAILSVMGAVEEQQEIPGEGEFLVMDSGKLVRMDLVITLFGKPGPAFDKYDGFANECLSCTGGYDL
ncbi:hypothetical protein RCC89_02790 [Cytophagaceae bacterium ABcell3]|nr:hypothetical protein RCC89_02790 [Cytophagaceae bacterium ABcell3]